MNHHVSLAALAVGIVTMMPMAAAHADSCWNHNGSTMRLQAQGQQRWLSYENPKGSLRASGVTNGTELFRGTNSGDWYSGTAKVFSKYCPGDPLEYQVEGPVSRANGQLRIIMTGQRPVHNQCSPTGRWTTDRLVFTYMYDC